MNNSDFNTTEKGDAAANSKTHAVQHVVIESTKLFSNRDEVMIRHNGEIYRLRITKNGKLIMNK